MSRGAPSSRWQRSQDVDRGSVYDHKWRELTELGQSIHGEVDFLVQFEPKSVLDAGCGTGRVAIELAARGVDVVGVDLDPEMLVSARTKSPELTWIEADLATVDFPKQFDIVVLAGNVMIFLDPGNQRATLANLVRHLKPGGRLVAGFQLDHDYTLALFDADCTAVGLTMQRRWSTWEAEPWTPGNDYAVSVLHVANV